MESSEYTSSVVATETNTRQCEIVTLSGIPCMNAVDCNVGKDIATTEFNIEHSNEIWVTDRGISSGKHAKP